MFKHMSIPSGSEPFFMGAILRPIEEAPKDGTRVILYNEKWQGLLFLAEWRKTGVFYGVSETDSQFANELEGWCLVNKDATPGTEEGFLGYSEDYEEGLMPTHFSFYRPPADETPRA